MKTMKKSLMTLMILAFSVTLFAQQSHRPGKNRGEAVAIGIRMGGNLASYAYPNTAHLDTLGSDTLTTRIRPVLGLNVEIPLLDGLVYVAPEIALAGRGDARVFHSDNWDTEVCYRAKVYYLEARLPVAVAFPVSPWLKPYVFAAPSFGVALPMGGSINQFSCDDPQSFNDVVSIDSSNMAPYDFGLMAGAGLRFTIDFSRFSLVVKAEAGYHIGFKDSFSEAEHTDQAQAANVNAYNINGQRLNRGIEAAIIVSLPLKFAPADACGHWSSSVYSSSRSGHRGF